MAKFLNKKEQVYDLKLTSYGHYLLSIGTFKPAYYTFLDDNIIYDKSYTIGTKAHAGYTQKSANPSSLNGKTLILTDAAGTSHTMTFDNNSAFALTTATKIRVGSATIGDDTHARVAEQVAKAISLANLSGSIGITPYWTSGSNDVQVARNVKLVMNVTGTAGNTKIIAGTVTGSGLSVVTTFGGGSNVNREHQNDIHKRIKEDTQYIESFVLFRDIESGSLGLIGGSEEIEFNEETSEYDGEAYFEADITPTAKYPDLDVFKFNSVIGDAFLDGPTQAASAWKIVSLQGAMSGSTPSDPRNADRVPQLNMILNYKLETQSPEYDEFDPDNIREIVDKTPRFGDNQIVTLVSDDAMLYVEEVNTELLTENFDIEVYEIHTASNPTGYDALERKYFKKGSNQIVDGFMRKETPDLVANIGAVTTSSVEYYFDILTDESVNHEVACRGMETYNKDSYYIDIDIECEPEEESAFFDIYGTAAEPEICLD
tara:strand:- start:744 stop:2201 length:1458 start_codon:yes stop_codon:yes gene_type:complete